MKKPRIDCIDGCRFALVFPIVVAHFARFSTSNLTALKLLVLQSKDVHLNVQHASHSQGSSTLYSRFSFPFQANFQSEAFDPGECFGGRLFRDLRLCLCLHHHQAWSIESGSLFAQHVTLESLSDFDCLFKLILFQFHTWLLVGIQKFSNKQINKDLLNSNYM